MFTKAKQTGKSSVTYWNEDGSSITRQGGNWTWRNQNPGNIEGGAWANRHGAIGKAGGFAVFPDYDTGRTAIFSLLQGQDYKNQTIWDAIPHYAPSKDHNDVKRYRKLVGEFSGLDLKRKIKDLSRRELEELVNAIERVEGKFKPGKITKNPNKKKISAVRKDDNGTIISYYVAGMGWLSKNRAIQLTRCKQIDAVISYSRSGSIYLKTRPDNTVENNLGAMG
ncbi:DUF3892 domain-containing protein [Bdellovibrionota bacterium FG-1]